MRDLRIVEGPDLHVLFGHFEDRLPVGFRTHPDGFVVVKLTAIEFEDGSGLSFNLRGYVQTEGTKVTGLPSYLDNIYYHVGKQTGTITVEEPALAPA